MQIKKETAVGVFILITSGVFIYMAFSLGFFRVDKVGYARYITYFKNISGLVKKADVKIAGVRVGWVDSLELDNDGQSVKARLLVSKQCSLKADAKAFIRQDGLLGVKFVEIFSGSFDYPELESGSVINSESREDSSIDDLIYSFGKIAIDLEEITSTLKSTLTDSDFQKNIQNVSKSFSLACNKITKITKSIESLLGSNQEQLNGILKSVNKITDNFSDNLVELTTNLNQSSKQLNEKLFPKLINDLDKIADKISNEAKHLRTDISDLVNKNTKELTEDFTSCTKSVKKAADNVGDLVKKINDCGDELINENCDVLKTLNTVKNCAECISNTTFGMDNNYEFFFKKGDSNFKSNLNFWINPSDKFFFISGLTFSKDGFVKKNEIFSNKPTINPNNFKLDRIKKDSFAFNFQAGTFFKDFAFRFGIFESTPGVAIDWLVPFSNDYLKLVSSFEIFDFTGKNSFLFNSKPHLKWLNRLYFAPNFYLSFGADNFANKLKRSGFFGIGLNFGHTYFN